MSEIKVFAMNECDWMAGEDPESVTKEYIDNYGGDEWDDCEPRELTDEEIGHLMFTDGDPYDPSGPGEKRTFRAQLDKMIADGVEFPAFFASTEY